MLRSKTRWITHTDNQFDDIKINLIQQLNITPLVASLLINRGYRTVQEAQDFLFTQNQDFYDPYLLLNMETAVERISKAINNQEKILVFGDYDAGATRS